MTTHPVTHAAPVLASILTADTPHWLAITFIAIGVAAYAACGLLTLAARWHHRRTSGHPGRALTATGQPPRPRAEVTS